MKHQALIDKIETFLAGVYGKSLKTATKREIWTCVSLAVMENITPAWEKSREVYTSGKQAHYFSAEFLVGRSLLNNLVNLNLEQPVKEVLAELNLELSELEQEEIDPGLGNGGLGRLAACFLDSCATLDLPVSGYGILYRYGLLRQEIENGFQKEYPDAWMEEPYPFHVRRAGEKVIVHYNDVDVYAVPYDLPVTGYDTQNVNTLRLWKPEPAEEFDFNLFNSQRFDDAVIQRNRVNDIYRVLYPNDTSYDGKVLRVRQQYFFVSASLQHIIKRFIQHHGTDFSQFPEFNSIQLNDTHPVLAIPELLRLLVDEQGVNIDQAWQIVTKTFAFTNHTVMQEALERWDISIFQFLFPRIWELIQFIDHKMRQYMIENNMPSDQIEPLSIIHNGQVHMANMAVCASYSVNGVAEIHSNILKEDTFKGYYKLWPSRFQNKTNGVTPRRWLRTCNPGLAQLLTEKIGDDSWVKDIDKLAELAQEPVDDALLERLHNIKHQNKVQLANLIEQKEGIKIDPNSIFDVQIKRFHEYKRQLLNALLILDQYYSLKENPKLRTKTQPVTYLFGGKAAPGYFRAKGIIKFINEVANLVNNDAEINGLIKVVFMHNYNVSYAERILPAADISEQISMVGKEASGTSNMKFMMNGALTLGTYDGANLEICDIVGEENSFMFGSKIEDMQPTLDYYNSSWQYEHIPGIKRVVDSLINGTFDDQNSGMFMDIYRSLLQGSSWEKADVYYLLGDFDAYRKRRQQAHQAYANRKQWQAMCWQNICLSGHFSSDRTISEYARDIWDIKPTKV